MSKLALLSAAQLRRQRITATAEWKPKKAPPLQFVCGARRTLVSDMTKKLIIGFAANCLWALVAMQRLCSDKPPNDRVKLLFFSHFVQFNEEALYSLEDWKETFWAWFL